MCQVVLIRAEAEGNMDGSLLGELIGIKPSVIVVLFETLISS